MSKLTDDLIGQYWRQANQRDDSWMPFIHVRFARAIEAAATEPLLQRIAELERQLEEARNQVLEEAAVECDKRAHAGDAGALMAARAIRALKGANE